jgi:hypothetical protein
MAASAQNVISIEVIANTNQAQQSLDALADTTNKLEKSVSPAGDALGDLAGSIDDIHTTSIPAADAVGGMSAAILGWVGVAAIAIPVIVGLVSKISDAVEEHERLKDIAERLDLPVDKVRDYSEEWLGVVVSLNEAARGFDTLSAAQQRAFAALDIFAGGPNAANSALTRVAAMSGSEADKVDVLRILTGLSEEDARKALDRELERLSKYAPRKGLTFGQAEGVNFGAENAGDLLRSGKIVPDARLKEMAEGRKELIALAKARADGEREATAEIEKNDVAAKKLEATLQRHVDLVAAWHHELAKAGDIPALLAEEAEFKRTQEDLEELGDITKSINKITEDGNKDVERSFKTLHRETEKSIEGMGESLEKVQFPFDDFVDSVKEGLWSIARTGELTFKSLINSVISSLLQKKLYDAIDKLGDSLRDALNASGSSGGFLGGVGKVIGSLFGGGGKAGGGIIDRPTVVGEDGPEIAFPGRGGASIANLRQIAFVGSDGGNQKGLVYAPVNHYSLSGVETQAVIAYIEQGQKNTQQGFLKMLYNNGFGRMR